MDSLISVISELRKISTLVENSELQLPQIVVVGSQSSGKSSVLEGIVGWDFLPRGTGIVTRRPLILNLVNVPENDPKRNQLGFTGNWATFEHLPNEYFTDFENVRQEIEDDTVRLVGNDKNISDKPINLTIYSSKVIDLSLVDLPGITRVPIGNQAITIEEEIRKIIHEYVKSPNSLILAVTPANQDVATSDALHLARKYDPEGKRTLCVLTKLDLMDRGTHALKELTGQTIPLKLGIIGVVNRSQAEIENKTNIGDCIIKEQRFLSEKYPSIASRNGTKFLRTQLNKLLINHIAEHLPALRDGINNLSNEQLAILDSLEEAVIEEDLSKLIIRVIRKFTELFKDLIRGYDDLDPTQLTGGAKIGREFRNFLSFDSILVEGGLTRTTVITAMRNAHGTRVGLFTPDHALEQLAKHQIRRLKEPSINFVGTINSILLEIVDYCTHKIVQEERNRFPRLYKRMNKIACDIVNARLQPAKDFVEKVVNMQLNYNNFKHPEFKEELDDETKQKIANCHVEETNPFTEDEFNDNSTDNSEIISEGYASDQKSSPLLRTSAPVLNKFSLDEVKESIKLQYYVKQYFIIVRNSLQDLLPKAIMMELVNDVRDNIQYELEERISASSDVELLTQESETITERREETKQKLEELKNAKKLLQDIAELNM